MNNEELLYIKIEYSEPALFNGWAAADLETVDVLASTQAFEEALKVNIYGAYPAAEIEIVCGDMDQITVGGDMNYPNSTAFVADLVVKVHRDGTWLTSV